MLPTGYSLGPMTETETRELSMWAEAEGWNPGLSDVAVAWAWQPQSFIALRRAGELVGGGSIVRHSPHHGFMGLFIVKPEFRGTGLGRELWFARRDLLLDRLSESATIGMDGVLDLVPFYHQGGFRKAWQDIRFEGVAQGEFNARVIDDRPKASILDAFDQEHFPAPRSEFLDRWLSAPGVMSASIFDKGTLVGFGALRPCTRGYKFGPVHARDASIAHALIEHLQHRVSGAFVQIDVPDLNRSGIRLAESFGFESVFACARMYFGPKPDLPIGQIFGVTSFEFG